MPAFRLRQHRHWIAALLAALVVALQGWLPLHAVGADLVVRPVTASQRSIPIEQQPFYPELVREAESWSDAVLDQVVGDSPQATLLNFYAVMAEVGHRADRLARLSSLQEGRLSAVNRREQIADASLLFQLAVKALDASRFPASVRDDLAEEAAIQLKHVLDYVFTHSSQPISVPDRAAMKQLNDQRTKSSDSWRIPGTAITLTTDHEGDKDNDQYVFSADTVAQIGVMYREILDFPVVAQPFATPRFYSDFIRMPGHIVPPDWYLMLPRSLRHLLEFSIYEQSVFQIVAAMVVIALYLLLCGLLIKRLIESYREDLGNEEIRKIWSRDSIAWQRVLLIFPIVPLTALAEVIVDDYVNFTGPALVVFVYAVRVFFSFGSGCFSFLFFEAVGRSGAELLAKVRGSRSALRYQRISSFLMPLCRAVGALVAVLIFYRLLIELGLPAETVLALSAVPGLAIGLGASKLLGNLFAGLSIQTDRPLRVGEFCRVGDNLGYITKIGLRSLEIQTLESRVTIPNAMAEEATIVNYSRRGMRADRPPMQALELRIQLDSQFSPYQLEETLYQCRRYVAGVAELQEPLVSLERRAEDSAPALILFGMVELHGWQAYLRLREQVLLHLEELVERAELSSINLAIAYGTSTEQLQCLPALMQQVVDQDPDLQFHGCRLERIGAFSYDHALEFRSSHNDHDAFEESLHALNRRIIETLALHGMEIPFPTQTLLLTRIDAPHA